MDGVTTALNPAAVERIGMSEPEWLRERRAHAWDVYERTPMPTIRLEEWRYTNLKKKLDLDSLRLSDAEALSDEASTWPEQLRAAMDEDREAAGHIVIIDGHVVHADIDEQLAAQGVILESLHEAITNHEELVREHLATEAVPAEEGKFAALNAALWIDGIFLYVPKGVQLEHPVRVTRWLSEAGAAYFSRVLILAEAQSQVSYVDEVLSDDFASQTYTSTAVELIARPSSVGSRKKPPWISRPRTRQLRQSPRPKPASTPSLPASSPTAMSTPSERVPRRKGCVIIPAATDPDSMNVSDEGDRLRFASQTAPVSKQRAPRYSTPNARRNASTR